MTSTIDQPDILDSESQLARTIVRLNDIKAAIAQLDEEKAFITEQLAKELQDSGSTIAARPDGTMIKATVVRGTTREVNMVRLEELDPDLFNKVTKRSIDTRALDRAINAGYFNTAEMLATLSIREKAPYVRLSAFDPYAEDESY